MSRSDTQGDDDDEGLSEHEKETRDEARRSAGVKRVSSQSSMDSGTTSLEDAKNKKSKTDSAASSAAARPPKSKKADFSTSYMESQTFLNMCGLSARQERPHTPSCKSGREEIIISSENTCNDFRDFKKIFPKSDKDNDARNSSEEFLAEIYSR